MQALGDDGKTATIERRIRRQLNGETGVSGEMAALVGMFKLARRTGGEFATIILPDRVKRHGRPRVRA